MHFFNAEGTLGLEDTSGKWVDPISSSLQRRARDLRGKLFPRCLEGMEGAEEGRFRTFWFTARDRRRPAQSFFFHDPPFECAKTNPKGQTVLRRT